MKIIAIGGRMHSGKSYVASKMERRYGFTRLSFARALKEDVRNMGFRQQHIEDKPPWMRQLLIAYGMAWRAVEPDHWVHKVLNKLSIADAQNACPWLDGVTPSSPDMFVIDDLRFKNEADALIRWAHEHEAELVLVHLRRDGYKNPDPNAEDNSETELDTYSNFDMRYHIASGDLLRLTEVADELADAVGVMEPETN